jgi:hypothetical protein
MVGSWQSDGAILLRSAPGYQTKRGRALEFAISVSARYLGHPAYGRAPDMVCPAYRCFAGEVGIRGVGA